MPNLLHRQAMMVALDRAQIKTNTGGDFAGDLADGTVKPNIGQDYAPTGLWETLLGQPIPDSGDPEYAKQLIAESGETPPVIRYQYRESSTSSKLNAGVVKTSLEAAGFKVELESLPLGDYYTIIFDEKKAHEMMALGWGADWPNAGTVLGPLFAGNGSWNLSRTDDPVYNKKFAAAQQNLNRDEQATAVAGAQRLLDAAGLGDSDAVRERPASGRVQRVLGLGTCGSERLPLGRRRVVPVRGHVSQAVTPGE